MDLLNTTLGAVGQVGDAIDKYTGGRAVRGTLAGKPRELASIVPFSDTIGLTRPEDKTSGRDLTDSYGLTTKGSNSFGSHAAGFVADNVLSPANWLGAGAAFKAAPTLAKGLGGAAKALTGADLLDHVAGGAKKLGGFLGSESGALKIPSMQRIDEASSWAGDELAKRLGQMHGGSDTMYVKGKGIIPSRDAVRPYLDFKRIDQTMTDPDSLPGLVDKIANAASDYTASGSGYRYINDSLRGTGRPGASVPGSVDGLKDLMSISRTPEHLGNLFRGIDAEGISHIEKMLGVPLDSPEAVGRTFTDPGFLSSSMNKGVAKGFMDRERSGNPGALLDLSGVPIGTRASLVHPGESEILFPPGRRIAIADNSQWPNVRGVINPSGVDPKTGIWGGLKKFLGSDSGYLRHAIPGVEPELANAMDGLGPQYPGGQNKLRDLAREALGSHATPQSPGHSDMEFQAWRAANPPGTPNTFEREEAAWMKDQARTANPTNQSMYSRLMDLISSPHAEGLASEIPEGSRFLGAGAEALTFKTPDGGVIRLADQPINREARADLPEMLQAYREAAYGPYKVEHLPMIHPVANAFDEKLKQAGRSIGDMSDPNLASEGSIDAMMAHEANQRMNYHHENMSADIRHNLGTRGFDPWDATTWNTGVTPEGKAIIFDGGAISNKYTLGGDMKFTGNEFDPKPTYGVPDGDLLRRVIEAGGPEKVRESLRKGVEHGTVGQGVDSGYLGDLLSERAKVQDFLRSHGVDSGPDIGRVSGSSPQDYAPQSPAPSMGKVLGTLGATAAGGGLLAYLLSGSQAHGNP